MTINRQQYFPTLPESLFNELVDAYNTIVKNFREGRWEPSELNGGKLCEIVYSIVHGHIVGSYPIHAKKPRNMVDACKALEGIKNDVAPRSFKIQIPRLMIGLYEVRNNRGVGHVGGDINPNRMDAHLVLSMSKWLLAELVRVFHNVSTDQATAMVEQLTERAIPVVWDRDDVKRVLNTSLPKTEQTLLLLYTTAGQVTERDLVYWVGHSNGSIFRRDILRLLHHKRLIEFDEKKSTAEISPSGIKYVEKNISLEI